MSGSDADNSNTRSVNRWLTLPGRTVTRWYRGSRLERTLARFAFVVRESRIVRWLTAEPDPDVIVIDLTETKTVGPVIALLDRFVPHVERAWNDSVVESGLARIATTVRTAPVRLTSAFVLGVILVLLALNWSSASTTERALLLAGAVPCILGLRVTWTWDELTASRAGRLATAILTPPEPPRDESLDEDG